MSEYTCPCRHASDITLTFVHRYLASEHRLVWNIKKFQGGTEAFHGSGRPPWNMMGSLIVGNLYDLR